MTTSSSSQPCAGAGADVALSLEAIEQSSARSFEQVMRLAIGYHEAGQLDSAEELYRSVLQAQPRHAQAHYHLGRMALQLNEVAAALPFLAIALEVEPQREEHWLVYLDALVRAGELRTARDLLALGLENGLQGAAVQAIAARIAQEAGSVEGREKPKSRPALPTARNKSVPGRKEVDKLLALYRQGRHAEAEALAVSLTRRFQADGFCWKILGVVILAQKRSEEALEPLLTATALLPQDAEAHSNLGMALNALGRPQEAEACYRRALKMAPRYAQALNNLGVMYKAQGRLIEAEVHYRQALEIAPQFTEAHCNLGNVLKDLGRLTEAEASYRRALAGAPRYAQGHNNLGVLLQEQGRWVDAEASVRQAVEIDPGYGNGYNNLGNVLQLQGRLVEAEAMLRRALRITPHDALSHSSLLFCLSHSDKVTPQSLFAEHRRYGERFEAPLRTFWAEHGNPRDPERCLQVGLVSGDLRSHAIAFFIEPVLERLAHCAGVSLHAYANHPIEDEVSQRLRGHFRCWYAIAGLSDAALADKIRSDGIDILIDLSGHTDKHRLLSFARKPAPVQASWMGYPGTTGLRSMDYYLSDRFLLPPGGFDWQFTEALVHLPANAPFRPMPDAPAPNSLPALRNGHLTFGSFNRPNKLSPGVTALWCELLLAVPDARMVLGAMPQDGHYEAVIEAFTSAGVARERLSFHPRASMSEYLSLHHAVDVCLDTFPYNGGTTTLHALWMGVPTLTLAGDTPTGRVGAAIMERLELNRFIASSPEDFVRQGVALARDVPALAALRAELRGRLEQSVFLQPGLIAEGLARALRTMWRRWCSGSPPVSFEAMPEGARTVREEVAA